MSNKKLLQELQQKTMPKIKTYSEYKTAYSMAMITIIHLEENYQDFKMQMTNERLDSQNAPSQEELAKQLKELGNDIPL